MPPEKTSSGKIKRWDDKDDDKLAVLIREEIIDTNNTDKEYLHHIHETYFPERKYRPFAQLCRQKFAVWNLKGTVWSARRKKKEEREERLAAAADDSEEDDSADDTTVGDGDDDEEDNDEEDNEGDLFDPAHGWVKTPNWSAKNNYAAKKAPAAKPASKPASAAKPAAKPASAAKPETAAKPAAKRAAETPAMPSKVAKKPAKAVKFSKADSVDTLSEEVSTMSLKRASKQHSDNMIPEWSTEMKMPWMMYQYVQEKKQCVSVDILCLTMSEDAFSPIISPDGHVLEITPCIPSFFFDPERLEDAHEEDDFNDNTHKATAFIMLIRRIRAYFNLEDKKKKRQHTYELNATPMVIKLPFKVEQDFFVSVKTPDEAGWELLLNPNEDPGILERLRGRPQYFTVLSINMVSCERVRRGNKGGFRIVGENRSRGRSSSRGGRGGGGGGGFGGGGGGDGGGYTNTPSKRAHWSNGTSAGGGVGLVGGVLPSASPINNVVVDTPTPMNTTNAEATDFLLKGLRKVVDTSLSDSGDDDDGDDSSTGSGQGWLTPASRATTGTRRSARRP